MLRSSRYSAVRAKSNWGNGIVEWTDGKTAYLSVVFSWNLREASQKAVWYEIQGYDVKVGGPAIKANPQALTYWADTSDVLDVVARHNPNATFTSRGCIRKCPFCVVPRIEGNLAELKDWQVRPVVCDNNLLACSQTHFDSVIDKLKVTKAVDFNQGLDSRLLTAYHAERLVELDTRCIRLAWDNVAYEQQFLSAVETLCASGFSATHIWCYVLIGFNDTPEDALYRLETIRALAMTPFPMRYQPIDAIVKNNYVASAWTDKQLRDYMRYWSNRFFWSIPFDEYDARTKAKESAAPGQLSLLDAG